jgi:hypothetical protein
MQPLVNQLERVRNRVRLLLIVMHVAAWAAVVLGAAMAAGFLDFLIRLPSWMRLLGLIFGIGVAVVTVAMRLNQAWNIWPKLTTLALRLERLMPGYEGALASAVAFATQPSTTEGSELTGALAERSMARARGAIKPEHIKTLIEPRRVWMSVGACAFAAATLVLLAVAVPQSFATASARWFTPFSEATWPLRNGVTVEGEMRVAPDNEPIRLGARITKGDAPGLRTWVVYSFEMADGSVHKQRQLMTRLDDGTSRVERRIEPRVGAVNLKYYIEAGDARSPTIKVKLFPPPTLRAVTADITPPAYAKGFVDPQTHRLLSPPRPLVTLDALAGSRIRLAVQVDGSVALRDNSEGSDLAPWIAQTLSGLPADAPGLTYERLKDVEGHKRFVVSWKMVKTSQISFSLADPYGKRYEDQRRFRFEVRADAPPRATILVPTSDLSVLPTAVVELQAEIQDDVAVEAAQLAGNYPRRNTKKPLLFSGHNEPQQRILLKHTQDLADLKVVPGDVITIAAFARDNYRLGDKKHDLVMSAPRRLRIISPEELVREVRLELAKVRDRAVHARGTQKRLTKAPANAEEIKKQQRVAQRVSTLTQTLDQLSKRIKMNRMNDEWLNETIRDAKRFSKAAQESAKQAVGQMKQAAEQKGKTPESKKQKESLRGDAKESQKKAGEQLQKLADKLDQGRTAFQLQQKLGEIAKQQRDLANEVRKQMPRTLGRKVEQLTDAERKKLEELAKKQAKLSEATKELAKQMLSTAAALQRQGKKPEDKATAEAIRKAAKIAQEQQLDKKMSKAAQQAKQNQLSQSQNNQQQSLDTLKQMQKELQQAEKIRKEILQRQLMKLVESIRVLKEQQEDQLNRLLTAKKFLGLDAGMMQLRRNTQAVAETARQADRKAEPVAVSLDEAAGQQAEAVRRLRDAAVDSEKVEKAERRSLAKIEEALKLAEELAKKAEQKQQENKRAELVQAYVKAMIAQKKVRQTTGELSGVEKAKQGRRWRVTSVKLAEDQNSIGAEIAKLTEKLREEGSIVYLQLHEQIGKWSGAAAGDLKDAKPSGQTEFRQDMIIGGLESLIEAMRQDPDDSKFDRGNQNGEGGGGGQGPQQKPKLVPSVAELKLLKQRQTLLHKMTRALDDGKVPAGNRKTMLEELGLQQGQLFDAAERLIKMLEQQRKAMQGAGAPKPGDVKQ